MKQKLYHFLLKILRFAAKIYLWRTKPYVIGVTGSVGKTSCRMIITQVLEQVQEPHLTSPCQGEEKLPLLTKEGVRGRSIYTSPKNYNSELGLIFSIFQIEEYSPSIKNLLKIMLQIIKESMFSSKKYDVLVAEYGIDSPGDMDFLLSVMKPDMGIITRLDAVHSENFPGGTQEYWRDKIKLLLASKEKTFYNPADSFAGEKADLFRNPTTFFQTKIATDFSYKDQKFQQNFQYKKIDISINLIGEENIHYTLLALRIAEEMGIHISQEKYNFDFFQAPGRFSMLEKNNNILIDSSYNASPKSMQLAIENTIKVREEIFSEKKIILVLGDMRELGEKSSQAHKKLVKNTQDISAVFTIGPEMFQYFIPALQENNFFGEIHSSLSSREIGKKLKKFLRENEEKEYIILFKGSQNTIFTEEALATLLTPTERKNLVRQSIDWKKKKDEFFESL